MNKLELNSFNTDGFIILRSFFDYENDIKPIHFAIYKILGIILKKHNIPFSQKSFSEENFDSGLQEIIKHDRKLGGIIYDAVKQIPAFIRICSDQRLENLFRELRMTEMPGIAAGGYGIRMNNPKEEKYRATWHQEYPAQLRSMDGIVYWSPLKKVTQNLGPVQIAKGSHKNGLIPVHFPESSNPTKAGAYSLSLENETEHLSKYEIVSPLTNICDLIVMDFKTIHSSGYNISDETLWSMQLRYFNFEEETGINIGWAGSFANGVNFADIHPELIVGNTK